MKSDGEASIVAFREALAKFHGGMVVPEMSAKGESQSNGAAEAAGSAVRDFTRVLKEQLEKKANIKVESSDVIVQWMVRWAAMLNSRFLVGKDGLTAYERLKGKKSKIVGLEFGERLHYRRQKIGNRLAKLDVVWDEGVFLGYRTTSGRSSSVPRRGS